MNPSQEYQLTDEDAIEKLSHARGCLANGILSIGFFGLLMVTILSAIIWALLR